MNEFFAHSATIGVVISLVSYAIGSAIEKRWKNPLLNPLILAIAMVILFLTVFHVDVENYDQSAKYLSYLLTPATVSLAIPLYRNMKILKKNLSAILLGVTAGVLTSLGSVLVLAVLFKLSHTEYVTLLPKSITTAIGIGVAEEIGGNVNITVAIIILTGALGNMMAETVCKVCRIRHPISKGIAIGSASHALGTAKALEMGEVEGAMSSLAIMVSGLLTVFGAAVFSHFL